MRDCLLPNPSSLFLLLIFILLGLVTLLFLPAIIETRNPKDQGPRGITENIIERPLKFNPEKVVNVLPRNLQQILVELNGKEISAIGADTIKIVGDVRFPEDVKLQKSILVEGYLNIGQRCLICGSVKASKGVKVEDEVTVDGDLISDGNVYLGADVAIKGSVHAHGSVSLGKNTFIGRSVVAGRNVRLYENVRIAKNIFSGGNILVLASPQHFDSNPLNSRATDNEFGPQSQSSN